MKRLGLFILSLIFLLDGVVGYFQPPAPTIYTFEQQIDHFNLSDTRTFPQRVLVYDGYWLAALANGTVTPETATIFFTPGGEANAEGGYQHNGIMFEWGMQIGAFMLFPEHRYYGKSLPFGPVDSYSLQNIVYLTVEQAMADYIAIIEWAKLQWQFSLTTPVIAFGGSYPGELAAFMRIAYPEIIQGSLASSAPIRYHPGMTISNVFFISTTQVFQLDSEQCPQIVEEAFTVMAEGWSDQATRKLISKDLGLCEVAEGSAEDLRLITLWIENAFATLGMEDYPYAVGDYPAWPMSAACQAALSTVASSNGNVVLALRAAIDVVYNASGKVPCHVVLAEYLPCADITGCGAPGPNGFAWDYQSCTQIVSDVDTGPGDMFPPHPYNFTALSDYCWRRWRATPTPLYLLQTYPYENTANIIWSNGRFDPWAGGGVLQTPNPQQQVIIIDFAAHHLDLRGSDPADPDSVTVARAQEWTIVQQWLSSYRASLN